MDARVGARDVLVAGSFAGALSLAFVLERGVRGFVAHEAGVGRDRAGISGLPFADRLGLPMAAVATASARIGDGPSVHDDGIVSHANRAASALGPLVIWSGTIWVLHSQTGIMSKLDASRVAMGGLALAALAGWLIIRPVPD